MSITTNATIRSFGGNLYKLTHQSKVTTTPMNFNLYLPPAATSSSASRVPLLIYLSGLTCTPENATEKGFFQHAAAKHGIALLFPDTSPRGLAHPGEDDAYDFGSGAGFYIDATRDPWAKGYKMYTYITEELPSVLFGSEEFGGKLDEQCVSITGHSMGGHGALTLFLRNPGKYKSVSAFAPILNPVNCDWGKKAFAGYFGEGEKEKWAQHDATELVKQWKGKLDVLIDVGTGDNFYKQGQLRPEAFVEAAKASGADVDGSVQVRFQDGYDHSYFFMASFADEHVEWAAKALGA